MDAIARKALAAASLLLWSGIALASPPLMPPASATQLAQLAANLRADVPTLNQIASVRAQYGANYRIPDATQIRFNSDAAQSNDLGDAFQQWISSLDVDESRAWYQCVGILNGAPGNFQASLRSWIKADTSSFVQSIAADAQNEAVWWQTYSQCLGAPQKAAATEQQEQLRQAEAQRQAQLDQQRQQQRQLQQQQYQQRLAQIEMQRQQVQNNYQQRLNAIQQNQATLQNNINNTVAAVDAYLQQKQAEEEECRQEQQAEQEEQNELQALREEQDQLNQQSQQSEPATAAAPVYSPSSQPSGMTAAQLTLERRVHSMYSLAECLATTEPNCDEGFGYVIFAANHGDAEAEYSLGLFYEVGISSFVDYGKAYNWYLKSANQDYGPAEYHLGHLFETGQGVTLDRAAAIKWYAKGSVDGSYDAKVALQRLQP